MLYTSGTTGQPKGAVGTHRNVITNVMNLAFAAHPLRAALRESTDAPAERPKRRPVQHPVLSRDGLLTRS